MKKLITPLLLIAVALGMTTCKKDGAGGVNLFTLDDDRMLGKQTDSTILANPGEYPILSKSQYPASYSYLLGIRDKILASGKVEHANDFDWEVKIIQDDSVLNAFCTAGGYIYVYTGLIKYLESEDQLAGVMGHEMGHADRRHSTIAMTQQYGISTLLSIIFGSDPSLLSQVANSLIGFKFSKDHERDADAHSVIYLCPTDYNAAGAAGFFEKLEASGQSSGVPEFLSTHPNPDNRIASIKAKKLELGCSGTTTHTSEYQQFVNTLP